MFWLSLLMRTLAGNLNCTCPLHKGEKLEKLRNNNWNNTILCLRTYRYFNLREKEKNEIQNQIWWNNILQGTGTTELEQYDINQMIY